MTISSSAPFDQKRGLLTRATVESYYKGTPGDPNDPPKIKAYLGDIDPKQFGTKNYAKNAAVFIDVTFPLYTYGSGGFFIGTNFTRGTRIVVAQGDGGVYYFVSFLSSATSFDPIPDLKDNQLLIFSNDNNLISFYGSYLDLGSIHKSLQINIKPNSSALPYIRSNIDEEYYFTSSSRSIKAQVKRETSLATQYNNTTQFDSSKSKLYIDDYPYSPIGLDPSLPTNDKLFGPSRNPAFVENREIVYEFDADNVLDDLSESKLYSLSNYNSVNYSLPNRRNSRADTLSLTLLYPNYLIETIKGTAVDILGNILDLNRCVIPIGTNKNTLKADKAEDKSAAFLAIKALERKCIAYHFELNARKDLSSVTNNIVIPDINSNNDYSRVRSRFFLDIDKEGQFKLNVPASSETGNVPLLTRYENYSSTNTSDNKNPNKLIFGTPSDIQLDSFCTGVINVEDGYQSPAYGYDRIKKDQNGNPQPLKHGMVFHDITNLCWTQQGITDLIDYEYVDNNYNINKSIITTLKKIVSTTIDVKTNPNAGGRSGSINMDGSLELNIGCNTIDAQSLWLDLAGGMVAAIGKDLNNKSAILNFDGDIFIQVGSMYNILEKDSRFKGKVPVIISPGPATILPSCIDIRVLRPGGLTTMFRIDEEGVKISSPGKIMIHASEQLILKSDGALLIESDHVQIQGHEFIKDLGTASK